MRKLLSALCCLVLLAGCAAGAANTGGAEQMQSAEDAFSFSVLGERQADARDGFKRFVWVSYLDLKDILCADADGFRANVAEMCDRLASIGATGVFLQVRAYGDAIYPSALFPDAGQTVYADYSADIDYLAVFCEQLHGRGIEVHAWINPYRLYAAQEGPYADFIEALRARDPLAVVDDGDSRSLNPGSETARALILDGVREVLDGYDVDGIHFDDYFYPTAEEAFDAHTYAAFLAGGGTMSLEDFRRASVSRLIEDVFAAVHEKGKGQTFGVSPDANIDRDYARHFANVELWCGSGGYVDYICPQIYFGFENESMPFSATLARWAGVCTNCGLIAGLSFYKAGAEDPFAGTGSAEWQRNFDIIARQYAECRAESACKGVALYRYASLFSPPKQTATYAGLELYNLRKEIG
ncbi:MAG: family 10 glycosylhydrolase [Oscillospiraceae bacterium]|nr:family 10 glycosylhydrolase [Oscillospiraceae bacterium]